MSETAQQPGPASLAPTFFIESEHPDIVAFARQHTGGATSDTDKAVALYYAVRDGFRYDPYALDMSEQGLCASTTLANGRGWCVTKAILLAACCRAVGVPARLGFADVRNHLTTERLREMMQTDVFYFHGYTAIYLNGQWLKATPAFNVELCEKAGIHPLEFDGSADSIYHEFDKAGNRHMEYLNYRGEYDDLPLEEMMEVLKQAYGGMFENPEAVEPQQGSDFEREVEQERA